MGLVNLIYQGKYQVYVKLIIRDKEECYDLVPPVHKKVGGGGGEHMPPELPFPLPVKNLLCSCTLKSQWLYFVPAKSQTHYSINYSYSSSDWISAAII